MLDPSACNAATRLNWVRQNGFCGEAENFPTEPILLVRNLGYLSQLSRVTMVEDRVHLTRRVQTVKRVAALVSWLQQRWGEISGNTVGFVPTMGALHRGHASLIERARRENAWVVVSIFVNPLQFGPMEDLDRYPRTLEADLALCESLGVDLVFVPSAVELYGTRLGDRPGTDERLCQVVPPLAMTEVLCGRSRPGHFQGVATVVTKLLSLVRPDRAYFGQKDAQQVAIIRRLVRDLNLPGEIVTCPIVREPSGLALSSRNQYLSIQEQEQAAVLARGLDQARRCFSTGERSSVTLVQVVKKELNTADLVQLEYVELVHPMTLETLDSVEQDGLLAVAGWVGQTRLIDNVLLRTRQPIIAIDGPAGAGKSTVARRIAQSLGLLYLDTGAMYRALTWFVLRSGVAVTDEVAIADLIEDCRIELLPEGSRGTGLQVLVNGEDVTQAIRSATVTAQVSAVAAQAAVRRALLVQQQRFGVRGGLVVDGRDIGTHVFPDAELKVFLTASVQERARRRRADLLNLGQPVPELEELERAIAERDYKDSTRAIAPLRQAEDALELQTDALSIEQVIAQVVSWYRDRLSLNGSPIQI